MPTFFAPLITGIAITAAKNKNTTPAQNLIFVFPPPKEAITFKMYGVAKLPNPRIALIKLTPPPGRRFTIMADNSPNGAKI